MESAQCRGKQPSFPDQEALDRTHGVAPGIWESPAAMRRFRLRGPSLFLAGLEFWYFAQLHWFSGSFRLQALGVLLLIYWILAGLFMTRQPAIEPEDDEIDGTG